jgi:hypothetical protein
MSISIFQSTQSLIKPNWYNTSITMPPNQETPLPNKEPRDGPIDSEITPKAFDRRQPVYDPTGKIEQINHDEVRVADVRQHPFGLLLVYLQISLGLLLSLGLIFFLIGGVLESLNLSSAAANALVYLFALLAVAFGIVFMILATRIYNSHQLIVTDQNITQVLQVGLFNRKVSELSMSNVEDVTAQKKGIFATLFNYGTLKIETAGEQNNFIFNYCPNPSAYAKALLDARAMYEQKYAHKDNN